MYDDHLAIQAQMLLLQYYQYSVRAHPYSIIIFLKLVFPLDEFVKNLRQQCLWLRSDQRGKHESCRKACLWKKTAQQLSIYFLVSIKYQKPHLFYTPPAE